MSAQDVTHGAPMLRERRGEPLTLGGAPAQARGPRTKEKKMLRRRLLHGMLGLALAPCLAMTGIAGVASVAHAADAPSLVADDDANVIVGLTSAHMWSTDDGSTWRQGSTDDTFPGRATVRVAAFDDLLVRSTPWSAERDYSTPGTVVTHEGTLYQNKWWSTGDVPGTGTAWDTPWEDLGSTHRELLATFDFTPLSGAEAEAFQESERLRVLSEKKVVGYFPEWGVYEAHDFFTADKVAWDTITHVNYAFGVLEEDEDGVWNVEVHDPYAAFDLDGGAMTAITETAGQHGVATMASYGGWTNSELGQFEDATATPERTEHIAQSMVDFMDRYGFDGVDVDWEYPEDAQAAEQFTQLLTDVRGKLTDLGKEHDRYYQLSIAVTPNHTKMEFINPSVTKHLVDTVNVMSYDFNGAFNPITGHNAPLYANSHDEDQKFNIAEAMREFHEVHGIPKEQLLVGLAYYGRGWGDVPATEIVPGLPGLFAPGTATVNGQWDDEGEYTGTNPYRYLLELEKDPAWAKHRDDESRVPYLYNDSTGVFLTYDDAESITEKTRWILDEGYGGAIIWELSGDTDDYELAQIVAEIKGESNELPTEPPAPAAPVALSLTEDIGSVEVTLTVPTADFGDLGRYIVRHDGAYAFEVFEGRNLYSSRSTDGDSTIITTRLVVEPGDEITLVETPGRPGWIAEGGVVVQTETVGDTTGTAEQREAVQDITVDGEHVVVALDTAAFESPTRYVVRVNGEYSFETYQRPYYSSTVSPTADRTEVSRVVSGLVAGDTITVHLTPGTPGTSTDGSVVIAEHVVD